MLKEKNRKKVLVTLCDESHVDMAKALFSSAYFKGGWDGDYLLLAHQVPEEKLKWFRDKGMEVWSCQPLSGFYYGNWKPVFLSKLYIFDWRIKKWNNVLYLDADCMVRASVKKLGQVKGFKARKIMMAFGRQEPVLRFTPKNHFNTGVLAFSTDVVQHNTLNVLKNSIPEIIGSIKNKEHLVVTDEIILSRYFKGRWKNFPWAYHVIPEQLKTFCFIKPEKVQGIILHHVFGLGGHPKPWLASSFFHQEWQENLRKANDIFLIKQSYQVNTWPRLKIIFYSAYYNMHKLIFPLYLKFDRLLGLIGRFLKKTHPKTYWKIKQVLPEKNEK